MQKTEYSKQNFQKKNSVPLSLCAFVPAFTLVEIMIVMVVIAIMVGITIPISQYVSSRARMASQKIYIEKIKSALEDYRAAYGEYPITPVTNVAGDVINITDVARHYSANLDTLILAVPSTVDLTTNTVEYMEFDNGVIVRVDYCLTWPLMLKQRLAGARPFMDFKDVTVSYLANVDSRQDTITIKRRKKSGGIANQGLNRIFSDPINRPQAIDPVSRYQWRYSSDNGMTYTLGTNSF